MLVALIDRLGWPRDDRGRALALGSAALLMGGLVALLYGDPFAGVYVAGAALSYLFLHHRLLPALVWLGVVAAGLWRLTGQELVGLLPAAGGLLLAGVAALAPIQRAEPDVLVEPDEPTRSSPPVLAGERALLSGSLPVQETVRGLSVRVLGRIEIIYDGEPITSNLTGKPTLAFLWLYLLVRQLSGEPAILRQLLAHEFSPQLPRANARERLRKALHDLQHDLHPALASALRVTPAQVSLTLDAVQLDVRELSDLAAAVAEMAVLPEELAQRASVVLESCHGELLPEFEEFEHVVTRGAGTAGDEVRTLRRRVDAWRADLGLALGTHHLSAARPAAAIQVLEPILVDNPDREDVRRRLIVACIQTGQTDRASELGGELALREG